MAISSKRMKEGLIGVTVPVYKVEKYISECIDSILAQTYTNFRLILIDDGTPDDAGRICDEYAKKDSRITVIHQENAGVTSARARGVEEADDCEFITFVDSDDMLAKYALEELHGLMDAGTDIVLGTTYFTENENRIDINPFFRFPTGSMEIEDFRSRMISIIGGMPWGRMFRRNIITPFVFEIPRSVYYGEDAIMNCRIAFNTENKIKTTDKPIYFYRQNTNGVCNQFTHTHSYEELLRKHIQQSIPADKFIEYSKDYLWRRIFLWRTFFNNSIRRPSWANTDFYNTLIKEIKLYEYNLCPTDWLLLKYTNPILRLLIITYRKSCSIFLRIKRK